MCAEVHTSSILFGMGIQNPFNVKEKGRKEEGGRQGGKERGREGEREGGREGGREGETKREKEE